MAIEPEYLKTACYFSKLEPDALSDIIPFVFEKEYKPGDYILWEGEKEGALYFVVKGLVKLFSTSAEGREFIARTVYGGDSFNDEGVFNSEENVFSAAAIGPTILYGLHYNDLAAVLNAHPDVNAVMAEIFAARQQYFSKLAVELVFKNATSRLARLLLDRQKMIRAGEKEQKITQQEMASMIGTVREIVGRSLRDLEEMGVIRLENNKIVIKNIEKLKELSAV